MEENEPLIFIHISSNSVRSSKIFSSLLPVGITFYARNIFLIEVTGYRKSKGMDINQRKSVRGKMLHQKPEHHFEKDERNGKYIDHSQERKINKKIKKEA